MYTPEVKQSTKRQLQEKLQKEARQMLLKRS